MSAQPNLDAGQLRRNQLKLAMSVGKNRHYVIHEIHTRHFVQTAALAAISETTIQHVLADLRARVTPALDATLEQLPADGSERTTESIAAGIRARLKLMDSGLRIN
ncbi:MAG: hypothetical protein U5S82_00415 [Gammaproteobacteria bacterium]|nr:hypothetical protein [Gammaproteobacteria bacterium]